MKRKNSTRNALFTSIISLLLCVSMLVGTTFAWFTDEVKSANNIIKSGNLDVTLEYWDGDSWENVQGKSDILAGNLWEPGYVDVAYLRLKNAGSLALNYQLGVNIVEETEGKNQKGGTFKLSDYIYFDVIEGVNGETSAYANREAALAVATVNTKISAGYAKADSLLAGSDYVYLAMVVHMPTTVGNEANHDGTNVPQIDLGINVFASQKTQESDSFGTDYDVLAQGGSTTDAAPTEGYKEYTVMSGDSNVKAATMQVHTDSVEDTSKPIEISIIPTTLNTNIAVTDEQKASTYEITVSNLKEGNATPIKVELNVGKGLTGVEVYHNETKINSSYNATTGYVIFETNSFSPYTVVRDAVAIEDEPTDTELPKATVTEAPEFVGTDIEWSSFGGFSPSNEEQQLEAAYVFTTPHTSETVSESKYKDWLCDFYVSVDRDVPDGAIFLAGNYGTYGWVGFENNGLPVSAGQEVPLLGTAIGGSTDGTTNWTYEQIVNFVSTFKCGVARTYGSDMNTLTGATFTVKLCLINPETNERTAVNTVYYTFAEAEEDNSVTDAAGLKAALAAGETEIEIKGNITLTEGLNASNVTLIGASEDAGINFNGHNIGGSGSITYKDLNLTTVSLPYADGANGERYGWYGGIDYVGHSVANYENCTITGVFTTYSGTVNATGCTFNSYVQDGEEFYNIFLYGNGTVNATNCTFMYRDRAIKIFSEGANTFTLNITGGKFVATSDYTVNKALINVDSTNFASAIINVKGITIDDKLASASLHNSEGNSKVTVTVE